MRHLIWLSEARKRRIAPYVPLWHGGGAPADDGPAKMIDDRLIR